MPSQFGRIVKELKRQEKKLLSQLKKVRDAISLLEFGSFGAPPPAIIVTPHAARSRGRRQAANRRRKPQASTRRSRR
jgi:hypothetical protein